MAFTLSAQLFLFAVNGLFGSLSKVIKGRTLNSFLHETIKQNFENRSRDVRSYATNKRNIILAKSRELIQLVSCRASERFLFTHIGVDFPITSFIVNHEAGCIKGSYITSKVVNYSEWFRKCTYNKQFNYVVKIRQK